MARATRRTGRMPSTGSPTRAMATRSNTRATGGAGRSSTSRRGSRRVVPGRTNNSTDGIGNRVIQRRRSSTVSPAAVQAPRRRRQVREPTPESEPDEYDVEDSFIDDTADPNPLRQQLFNVFFGNDSDVSFVSVRGNNVTINISSTADESDSSEDEENDDEDDEEESGEEEEIVPREREMSPVDLHDEEDEVLSQPDENENPHVVCTEMFGDCTICLEDKPQDPVGCLHCQQLVGCRKCVMKWYNTSSSIEAKKLCPLCRHTWEQRPEVCTMFDLVITS